MVPIFHFIGQKSWCFIIDFFFLSTSHLARQQIHFVLPLINLWNLLSTSLAQGVPLQADSETHVNKIRATKRKSKDQEHLLKLLCGNTPGLKMWGKESNLRHSPCIRVELWLPSAVLASPSQLVQRQAGWEPGGSRVVETNFWDFTIQFSPSSSSQSFSLRGLCLLHLSRLSPHGRQWHSVNGCEINYAQDVHHDFSCYTLNGKKCVFYFLIENLENYIEIILNFCLLFLILYPLLQVQDKTMTIYQKLNAELHVFRDCLFLWETWIHSKFYEVFLLHWEAEYHPEISGLILIL